MDKIKGKLLKQKIERFDAFEKRMQIRMENFSVKVNNERWVTIFCEVHPLNGTTINSDMNIECVLYDNEESIIDKEFIYILSEDFFGFEVIELTFQEDGIADEIKRIRIYPKK